MDKSAHDRAALRNSGAGGHLVRAADKRPLCKIFLIRAEHIGVDTQSVCRSAILRQIARVMSIIPTLRCWLKHFPLTPAVEGMKSAWRRACVTAGMRHVKFHDFRHSCVTILVGLGGDLYTISKMLGHCSAKSTQQYTHLQVAPVYVSPRVIYEAPVSDYHYRDDRAKREHKWPERRL